VHFPILFNMKRQGEYYSQEPHIDTRCRIDNDCYDEILQQQNDDLVLVRNTWLNDRSPIKGNESNILYNSSKGLRSEGLKSLSQQLIQVKRRMWPAAEECATSWETTPSKEFWNARGFNNPMEPLGEYGHRGLNQMFINRSAIKLANINAILGFKLIRVNIGRPDLFLFADLCGAPGGFSEYIMNRFRSNGTRGSCRGYGMSLVGKNEHGAGARWRLEDFCQIDTSFSINYRILFGDDGTGDIYNWENILCFQKEIERDLQEAGIQHRKMNLVVADGGFDAQRDSECQEQLAQKLVLCEFAASLQLLDHGGTLVIKLFGCQTESIRMAMRSVFDFFDSLEIIKPISSRPASSERYVLLEGFKGLPAHYEGGQNWISNVLIGKCLRRDLSFYSRVDNYLDQVDHDMLVLNLKACFAILTTLRRRQNRKRNNCNDVKKEETDSTKVDDEDECGSDYDYAKSLSSRDHNNFSDEERNRNNVKMYKHAWQLFL